MKILENGKIQLDIGEDINIEGEIYTVARDDKGQTWACRRCPLYGAPACSAFACSPLSRDDDAAVHFEEKKQ